MTFKNAEEVYKVFAAMIEKVQKDEELVKKLVKANLVVALEIPNLDGLITLDLREKISAAYGPTDIKPNVTTIQNDDVFNKFWQGKVNLMMATITGKIKTKGPVTDMFTLVPALNPVYDIYVETLKEAGLNALID